uniref:NADH dehydrogenase subunit 4L n=1 Tax=Philonthus spinipes TaxID=878362 RepID=UPI001FA7A809|nr:NADH dehydrogenase subunit 4L [Philonthus spinipes]ULT46833.1 NADH dehydrogenase subunit 4L [Philonthus spinipes]
MVIFYLFSIYMYMMGLVSFCLKRKHFLLMLLSLEFIILSLYFMLITYLSLFSFEYYFSMIFLSMSVCEGALGLSLLVSMIRTHGNDYFQTFNVLW